MKYFLKIFAVFWITCAVFVQTQSQAQTTNYPDKPIKLVIPFAAGGSGDIIGRLIADRLSGVWKQPVLADNKAGAGGNIASDFVAKASPDGMTLLLAANSHVINSSLYNKLPYDSIKDFTALAGVAYYSLFLVVNNSLPANNFNELLAYAKSNPGALTFGSAGTGTPTHLANELLKNVAGIDIIHSPYKGAAPATTDLLGGHIQAMFNNPISALPFIKSGKLRALASTGPKRSVSAPEIPTVAELGFPNYEVGTWFALLGPKGMPLSIVNKISNDTSEQLKTLDVIVKMNTEGIEPWIRSSSELSQILVQDQAKWGQIIKEAHIKLD